MWETDSELTVNTVDYSTSKECFDIQNCIKCGHLYTNQNNGRQYRSVL